VFNLGMIVGAFIATFVLGFLFNWMVYKRLRISAQTAVALSSLTAIVVAIVVYGFGNADGGPWSPGDGVVSYVIGGLLSGAVRFVLVRRENPSDVETFK
jgi:O-antigen/teichoic acid export membrane protein